MTLVTRTRRPRGGWYLTATTGDRRITYSARQERYHTSWTVYSPSGRYVDTVSTLKDAANVVAATQR